MYCRYMQVAQTNAEFFKHNEGFEALNSMALIVTALKSCAIIILAAWHGDQPFLVYHAGFHMAIAFSLGYNLLEVK